MPCMQSRPQGRSGTDSAPYSRRCRRQSLPQSQQGDNLHMGTRPRHLESLPSSRGQPAVSWVSLLDAQAAIGQQVGTSDSKIFTRKRVPAPGRSAWPAPGQLASENLSGSFSKRMDAVVVVCCDRPSLAVENAPSATSVRRRAC